MDYVSAVQRGNVLATQFHPEKSAAVGLAVLDRHLRAVAAGSAVPRAPPALASGAPVRAAGQTVPRKRVVACLDVRSNDDGDLVVTKGDSCAPRRAPSARARRYLRRAARCSLGASPRAFLPPPRRSYNVREAAPAGSVDGAAGGKGAVRNLGKPVSLAARYYEEGADEITFLNITGFRDSPLADLPMLQLLVEASQTLFVPLCVGGGIRDYVDQQGGAHSALHVAAAYFRAGADKVSIGSEVGRRPSALPLFPPSALRPSPHPAAALTQAPSARPRRQAVAAAKAYYARGEKGDGSSCIEQIAHVYGRQAVVISVDPRRVWVDSPAAAGAHAPACVESPQGATGPSGERFCWYECTVKGGREGSDLDVVQLARGVEALGAGELLLNSIDADGQSRGFDLGLVSQAKGAVSIPVIASSGAGKAEHFSQVFEATGVEVRAARRPLPARARAGPRRTPPEAHPCRPARRPPPAAAAGGPGGGDLPPAGGERGGREGAPQGQGAGLQALAGRLRRGLRRETRVSVERERPSLADFKKFRIC